MRQWFEQTMIRMPGYYVLKNLLIKRRQKKELLQWKENGRPLPPPHLIKQDTLRDVAKKYRLKTLVETGTYLGDMVEAMKNLFDRIYSIELSPYLWRKAQQRFKGQKKITIIQGDSGVELKNVIARLSEPALFWLDGHYSAGVTAKGETDTPILKELDHILKSQETRHVICIDDAHLFGADPAYPSLDQVRAFVTSSRPNARIDVQNNIIIITP